MLAIEGRTEFTAFTDTRPPRSVLWFTVSRVEFSPCATRMIPLPASPLSPSRIIQVIHDSFESRTGQWSRPSVPTISTIVSIRGGARISRVTLSPEDRSTTVEFCTKPVAGSIRRYGTKTAIPALALSSTCWNTPASRTSGVMLRLAALASASSSPKQPLSGAETIRTTSRRAIPLRERTLMRAAASC